MNKTELKTLIKEAFLTEKKNTLLNEGAPGFDNRKQGEALPTLESIKAAYEAKNDIKEDTSKAKELSDRVLNIAAEGIRDLNGTELMEFRALIAQAFDMKDEAKKLEEKAEETKEETEATKELTAAVKDLSDAKKEAGLKEDRFVDAALEDLRTVINNLAHTSGMGKEEAAEMAMMHIEDMFMGEGEIEEGVEKDYWADYTDIGMFYLEGSGKEKSLTDNEYEELGKKIVKQLYNGDVGKAYDNIVRGRKRGSIADLAEREEDEKIDLDDYIESNKRTKRIKTLIGTSYLEGSGKEKPLTDNELEELGEEIINQLYGGDRWKAYDDIVTGKKQRSGTSLEENMSDDLYFSFLNDLRDSGKTNMLGAAPYLQSAFDLEKREAREILTRWMKSFSESIIEGLPKGYFDKKMVTKDEVHEEETIDESVITEADMIVESFKK